MKKLLSKLIPAVLIMLVLAGGCNREKKCQLVCENGGTCENGACNCPPDYSGTNCETPFSSTYGGEYSSDNLSCGGVTFATTILVRLDPADPKKLQIDEMFAELTDATHFKITGQKGGFPTTGSGTIDGRTMTLKFTVQYVGSSETCTGSFKKK